MAAANTSRWSDLKKKLAEMDRSELLALVKDLHDASKTNQAFLAARLASPLESADALESYRERIVRAFYPGRGSIGDPKLSEGRAVLREFKRARPGDLDGYAELLLTYVETGTRFTNEFGDIDEPFYNSLVSVLRELTKLLALPFAEAAYYKFEKRLIALKRDTYDIGWGYGDDADSLIGELQEAREPEPE